MSEPLTDREFRALARFRHLLRRFLKFSEAAAKSQGLHGPQHQLLLAVRGVPEGEQPTIGFLARMLQLRHHSTVELVDRLVERGLVERFQSERDRRRVIVQIRPDGQRILEKLSLLHRKELRSARAGLIHALSSLFEEKKGLRLAGGPSRSRRGKAEA